MAASVPCPPQTLTFQQSPIQPASSMLVRTRPGQPTPIFSVTGSDKSIAVSRLPVAHIASLTHSVPIASITFHSFTSTSTDIIFHGQHFKLKPDMITGTSYNFTTPQIGKFKWSSGLSLSGSMVLKDPRGVKLAKLKPGKSLEVLVPCDDFILDLIVVSGLAAQKKQHKDAESASQVADVVGAVAGAS